MNKKIIVIFVLIFLCLSILASCGKTTPPDNNTDNPPPITNPTENDPELKSFSDYFQENIKASYYVSNNNASDQAGISRTFESLADRLIDIFANEISKCHFNYLNYQVIFLNYNHFHSRFFQLILHL